MVKIDLITKERPDIMRMLLLAAFSRFFVMGATLVGLLFIIRAVLVAIGICMIPAGAVFLFRPA